MFLVCILSSCEKKIAEILSLERFPGKIPVETYRGPTACSEKLEPAVEL